MTLLSFLLSFIIISIMLYIIKKIANGPLNPIKKDLTGKLIIVTGSSDGLGLETAKDLLTSNAKVIFACRNKSKTEGVINKLPENMRKNAIFIQLDLEKFKSIENFVKEIKSNYQKIDVLINNAGLSFKNGYKTEDGYLNVFQVNYLGSVLLTLLLLEHFNEKESKIINISSVLHKKATFKEGDSKYLNNFELMNQKYFEIRGKERLYENTKLLVIYFTQYLSLLAEKKYPYLKAVCLHPGVIYTNIFQPDKMIYRIIIGIFFNTIFYLFTKDVLHGAQTQLFLCYSDNKDLVNGAYYSNLKIEQYLPKAKDEKLRNEMINETLKILKNKYKELEYIPFI